MLRPGQKRFSAARPKRAQQATVDLELINIVRTVEAYRVIARDASDGEMTKRRKGLWSYNSLMRGYRFHAHLAYQSKDLLFSGIAEGRF